ncbi:MAG: hypothetical protein R2776_00330 [Flavobacteriaceae bacterium]|nr:hypothetical protein [Flavobacteriaceae bacterium]
MKNRYYTYLVLLLFASVSSFAQIGIGTSTPEGTLDVEIYDATGTIMESPYGIILPKVSLTSTIVSSPVINPNGGGLEPGTTVYNTNNSTNGANDVSPGIYSWTGSSWEPQFFKKEYAKYEQTGGCQRTTIKEYNSSPEPTDADNIAGLTNQTFTPTYSGYYKIEVRTNFGAGRIQDFTSGTESEISLATSEGAFFFTMSGSGVDIDPTSSSYDYTEGWSYTHSYSAENDNESPAVESYNVGHYATLVYRLYLLSGSTYTFTLSNCITTGHNYFINNGDSGDGQGHIGHYIPCSIEFTYVGD